MRKLILAMILAASSAQGALADTVEGPNGAGLAPGEPSGLHAAQLTSTNTMVFVGLGVLVLGAGLYMAGGHYKIPGQSGNANQTSATGTSP
jgi:hypothetical protein